MKKRIISFALALLLVLGLAACGQSGTQSGTTANTAAAVSNGGTLPLPAETTISDAESAPTTTAAAEPAEDPNEIVELQVSMTTVMAQTRGGEVWFFEEHNDEPLHYEHVRKAYPTELVDLDQDVERIYPDLSVYQKNGKLYNAVFVEGKLTALEMPQNEVDVPMYCGGEKLVYLGTDGMLHCSVNSYERIGGTLVLSCVSDVSYAGKLDSMEAVYRFLED